MIKPKGGNMTFKELLLRCAFDANFVGTHILQRDDFWLEDPCLGNNNDGVYEGLLGSIYFRKTAIVSCNDPCTNSRFFTLIGRVSRFSKDSIIALSMDEIERDTALQDPALQDPFSYTLSLNSLPENFLDTRYGKVRNVLPDFINVLSPEGPGLLGQLDYTRYQLKTLILIALEVQSGSTSVGFLPEKNPFIREDVIRTALSGHVACFAHVDLLEKEDGIEVRACHGN